MDVLDLCYLSAQDLRKLYQRREVSPVEVTKAVLSHIGQIDPSINAFVTVTPEIALKQARAAELTYGKAETPPQLAGIPVSLKDLTPTKGIRTTRGSLLSKDWLPEFDAPIVERLYAAGVVLLGKTNTPERGWKGGLRKPCSWAYPQSLETWLYCWWVEWWGRRGCRRGNGSFGSGN